VVIHLEGVSEWQHAVTGMVGRTNAATRMATAKGAHLVEREIKINLAKKTHEAGTPTPSEPGEPPALVTGTLRRSIKVTGPEPTGPATWMAKTGPTAVYGRVQELGGEAGSDLMVLLPPRPYVAPALAKVTGNGELRRVYRDAWAAAIHM